MSKEPQKSNFELAQEEANKIDLQIIDTLQKGYNFRVEAGAGSGKTYSLNKVIEWIQVNKWKLDTLNIIADSDDMDLLKKYYVLLIQMPQWMLSPDDLQMILLLFRQQFTLLHGMQLSNTRVPSSNL